jgi:uncharacterized protein (TIGR02300 family)
VAKPELGTKRLCPGCGARFYDLSKDPITCPKCSTVVEIVIAPTRGGRGEAARAAAAAAQEVEVAETPDAEFVSLEQADAETEGTKPAVAEGDEVEVEDEALDDAAFIVPEEEEEDDVADIIGGDIENEEET